jgi:membrane protein implicated in regulation of membrane protease activity
VTTAQIVFSIALGALALLITFFAGYVVSSTLWGDRWVRRRK